MLFKLNVVFLSTILTIGCATQVTKTHPKNDNKLEGAWIAGYSVKQRPIVVEQYGYRGPVLTIISAIHGNERAAVTFGEEIRSQLQGGLAEKYGIQIIFVGGANPDGIAAETRHNTNRIDLNRNFPTENFTVGIGGSYPLSEPESRILKNIIDNANTTAVISVHCCIPLIDYDGKQGKDLANAISDAMSSKYRFPIGKFGAKPGSLGSYVGLELGLPMVTIELALDKKIKTSSQLDTMKIGIEKAAQWVSIHGHVPQELFSMSELDKGGLEAFSIGTSAGNLPIRVELFNHKNEKPILILAGLEDNEKQTLHLAEHLRRILYAHEQKFPIMSITAANPDGIAKASPLNANGQNVAQDFIEQRFETPEASALWSILRLHTPRMVIHVTSSQNGNRVSALGIDEALIESSIPNILENQGQATESLANLFYIHNIPYLRLEIQQRYARGDNRNQDFFPKTDPKPLSDFVRRIIHGVN